MRAHRSPLAAARSLLFLLGLPVLLVGLGDFFVLQKRADSPVDYLRVGGDTFDYLKAIDGDLSSVDAPYRYRVLVPMIARLVSVSPLDALKTISTLSLLGSYLLILMACEKLGLSRNESALGLAVAFLSRWHLFHYHNPFLTDAFGLLVLCAMSYTLLAGRFGLFLVSVLAGGLAREATVFLAPAWFLVRDRKRGVVAVVLVLIVLAGLRVMLPGSGDSSPDAILFHPQPVPVFLARGFLSWSFLWFTLIAGLCFAPREKSRLLITMTGLLFTGAALSALFVTDTERMFSILMPVIAPATALFLHGLLRNGMGKLAAAIVAVAVLNALFALPNRFYSPLDLNFNWPKLITTGIGTVTVLWSVLELKRALSSPKPG